MKYVKYILVSFLFFMIFLPTASAKDKINVYLFYGDGCSHCAGEREWFKSYVKKNDDINYYEYEVWYNQENIKKWVEVQNVLNREANGVPYLVIGEKIIVGFGSSSTPDLIKQYINHYQITDYQDKAGVVLGIVSEEESYHEGKYSNANEGGNTFKVPILGEVNIKTVSIPLLATVIGLVDGFNPCAMWILLFLITMLFGMKDRKKMWILGLTFIFTSGIVYFLFMATWLKFATFATSIILIRILISLFAFIFGMINVFRYFSSLNKDVGCDVTSTSSRKKIMIKIKNIVKSKSFFLAILGIMGLAFFVNLIELLCSLGLPVVFTEILALNNINSFSKIIYMLIYILFFLIDDIIVFIIAMKTLKINAISNKYSKYSHLIGGLIMITIGLLLFFKPEYLMFNF